MKQFSYFTPATLAEATEVAKGYGFDVSYLAGGTDLIVRLKNDHIHRPAIIDLKKIDEIGKNISQKGDRVVIGALVTLSTLEENEWVKAHFPALPRSCVNDWLGANSQPGDSGRQYLQRFAGG